MLECFFGAERIEAGKSLCFFYAKQTPLTEDSRRVIVGVGFVSKIDPLQENTYTTEKPIRSYIWDRVVHHSIRPNFKNRFILPYQEILKKASEDPNIDPGEYVAFAPEEHQIEFSYGSEHVTNDGAIPVLICGRSSAILAFTNILWN